MKKRYLFGLLILMIIILGGCGKKKESFKTFELVDENNGLRTSFKYKDSSDYEIKKPESEVYPVISLYNESDNYYIDFTYIDFSPEQYDGLKNEIKENDKIKVEDVKYGDYEGFMYVDEWDTMEMYLILNRVYDDFMYVLRVDMYPVDIDAEHDIKTVYELEDIQNIFKSIEFKMES